MGLLRYMPDSSIDPDVEGFLEEQHAFRRELIGQVRRSESRLEDATDERLWTNYKLMEVYAQLAQFLCNRFPLNSIEQRNGPSHTLSSTPVPTVPRQADVTLTVAVQDETPSIVRPYPFGVDPVVLSFPGRLVHNRPYVSQDDFLRYFYRTDTVPIRYVLSSAEM